jgi:hypothetical protein
VPVHPASLIAKTFFDFPLWHQLAFGALAGVFGLFPAILVATTVRHPEAPRWLGPAIVLAGAAITAGILVMFMLSKEMDWGGQCAPAC